LNKGKAQKDLAAFIPVGGAQITEELKEKPNYKAVITICRKDPRKITRNAIGSIFSTTIDYDFQLQPRSATPGTQPLGVASEMNAGRKSSKGLCQGG
jgi:hypothetical protein